MIPYQFSYNNFFNFACLHAIRSCPQSTPNSTLARLSLLIFPLFFSYFSNVSVYPCAILKPEVANSSKQLYILKKNSSKQTKPAAGFLRAKKKQAAALPPDLEKGSVKDPRLIFLIASMGSLEESSGAEVVTIDVHKAKSQIESGHVYLDVRTEEEFRAGHPDAETIWKLRPQEADTEVDQVNSAVHVLKKIHNIPYMFNTPQGRVKNPEFLAKVKEMLKEDDHIVVGCQSGVRSVSATADLLSAGFKQACNMGGGYLAWEKNGLHVKKQQKQQQEL